MLIATLSKAKSVMQYSAASNCRT